MRALSPLRMSLLFSMMMLVLSTPAWSQSWQDVAGDLMSPACPGRTLLNCTSSQAEQWRELIRQKLTRGETKEQILRYFVDIGGEGILAAPPKQGFALTAWLLPLFVMVNGAGLIVVLTRRWAQRRPQTDIRGIADDNTTASSAHPVSDPYLDRLHRELKEFDA
jgi:cytochrome c-type biogenesis protein CcmH/NrfF